MEEVQLTFKFTGLDPKAIANSLRMQAALIEGVPAKTAASKKVTSAPVEEEEVESDEDDEFSAPAKKTKAKKAAAAAFDDEEDAPETEDEEQTDEDEEEEAPPKKAKKITIDDCNDAAKARAARIGGKEGRSEVLAILKKQFKTASISEIKPELYPKLMAALKA